MGPKWSSSATSRPCSSAKPPHSRNRLPRRRRSQRPKRRHPPRSPPIARASGNESARVDLGKANQQTRCSPPPCGEELGVGIQSKMKGGRPPPPPPPPPPHQPPH